jgi:hypothetical protein
MLGGVRIDKTGGLLGVLPFASITDTAFPLVSYVRRNALEPQNREQEAQRTKSILDSCWSIPKPEGNERKARIIMAGPERTQALRLQFGAGSPQRCAPLNDHLCARHRFRSRRYCHYHDCRHRHCPS